MLPYTLFALAIATPQAKYPFNNQLPPVARYGEAYSYQLNPDTFSSSEAITLSCPDLPWWLSFDASTHTFSGTPPSDSSDGDQMLNFTILASDYTGTITSDCKLALVSSKASEVSDSLVDVLRKAGPTSDSSSLVLSPGENFEFDFPENYFTGDGKPIIGHYGVTSEHAPLPIWLHFDGSQRKFWGTVPAVSSEIAQAEVYSLIYIESTVQGFTTASSDFHILVGAHSFSTNLTQDNVNVTEGEFFSYQIPFNEIQLNGHPITPGNVSTVQISSLPSWLEWNNGNNSLNGVPSSDSSNKTFSMKVTVHDLYGDSVQFDLNINVQQRQSTTVFKSSSIGPVNVTQGQYFSYSLEDSIVSDNIEISIDSDQDWISYESGNYSIQGQVPSSFNGTTITLNANVINRKKRDTGTSATITLLGVPDQSTMTASSSSTSTSTSTGTAATATSKTSATSAPSASETAGSTNTSAKSNKKKIALICGLSIPLGLLFLLALILLLFFCRRRRQRKQLVSSPKSTLAEKGVSAPVLVRSDDSPAFLNQPPSIHTGGDDGTMVGTPEMEKEGTKDWTTPQRVSAFNFLQMDADGNNVQNSYTGSDPSNEVAADTAKAAAVSGAVNVHAINSVDAANGSAAAAEQEESKYANVPRASWRHTNITDRRWQDTRVSYNSIASVADGSEQIYQSGHGKHLPRDESSGIVHAMGSDFSSREQSMQFSTLPEEDSASSHYHTASSGDEEDALFYGDSSPDITPYKNSNGSFEFRQGSKASNADKRAQLRNSEFVIGKPQTVGHKPHNSQSGELAFI